MSRGRRVLDLGSGAGYFPLICRTEGHRPLALDLDDEPLYRELIEFFGLPRLVHRIAPLQSLPDDLGEFDVVTAFRICFDTNGDGSQWGADEWAFLLQDLRTRLTPGGRVVLGFNVNRQTGTFYSPATAALLKQLPGYRTRLFFEYALLTRTA